jgi:hypothetical protein
MTRHEMGRRQFLVLSSTCALATAAIGPKLFAAEGASLPPKRLAVGFAPFEAEVALTAASDIPSADGAFIGRGARIAVSGASGAPAEPRARRAVELHANFSYMDGAERRSVPFRAWACSRTTGCQGNPLSFTMPVDEVQSVTFTVATETGPPAGPASRRDAFSGAVTESNALPVTLTTLSDAGSLKLTRGFYVIVPLFENDSEPRWGTYRLRSVEGRMTLVDGAGAAAPFEHFVLRIDYANA